MEKCYIVTSKEFLNEIAAYEKNSHDRNEFFIDFAERYGIDGNLYYFGGTGSINCSFREYQQKEISLSVESTNNNLSKFGSDFKKSKRFDDLSDFKKTSSVLKAFQKECIEKKIVINLYDIRIADYFKETHLGGIRTSRFEYGGKYYLRVSTDRYDSLTPEYEGFEEIKQSDFHLALEKAKEEREK